MKQCCVVIPVHSATPSIQELLSFKRCFAILGSHDIYVVAPDHLDLTVFREAVPSFSVKIVPAEWLCSIKAYNKMKINPSFYSLFSDYRYMLTYEPDAYVFRDELTFWCGKEFDYIGAPFFNKYDKVEKLPGNQITGVGNSGFSLRDIQHCIQVLAALEKYIRVATVFDRMKAGSILRALFMFTAILPDRFLYRVRIVRAHLANEYTHEDVFWSIFIPAIFPAFRIADKWNALQFSFDANPALCFELNERKIPFGCHAWVKNDFNFWNDYIS